MSVLLALQDLYRYDVISDKPVGKGGCGNIWEARDILFDRPVAIKTIGESLTWDPGERAQAERSFRKEAIAGARLGERCRTVVKVLDVGITHKVLFFVMEWVAPSTGSGIDISSLLGRVTLSRAKKILFDVSEAVAAAHAAGIVHSDIAPWNIVYDATSDVYKLCDFGLLKIVEEKMLSAGSGSLLTGGRAAFMPTSVRLDIRKASYSSDVFALATTFGTLLEGLSFLDRATDVGRTGVRIQHEQRDAPDQVRQLLRRFIDDYCETHSVDEFVAALQRIPQ